MTTCELTALPVVLHNYGVAYSPTAWSASTQNQQPATSNKQQATSNQQPYQLVSAWWTGIFMMPEVSPAISWRPLSSNTDIGSRNVLQHAPILGPRSRIYASWCSRLPYPSERVPGHAAVIEGATPPQQAKADQNQHEHSPPIGQSEQLRLRCRHTKHYLIDT
jgi:hypothetical protein